MKSLDNLLQDHLRRLIQKLTGKSVDHIGKKSIRLDFDLSMEKEDLKLDASPSLEDQLRMQIKEIQSVEGGYLSGRVYCYLCESAGCSHAAPAGALMVFGGYQPNGMPAWKEITEVFIDAQDDRLERFYGGNRQVIARYMRGRDLKNRMLPAFGRSSKTYDVLAQVVFGLLKIRDPLTDSGLTEMAVTLQAVESRQQNGRIKLNLNVIPGVASDRNLLDDLAESPYDRIYRAIRQTMDRLAAIEQGIAGQTRRTGPVDRGPFLGQIPRLMMDLVSAIDQGNRQDLRRTRHAINRQKDNRPISAATQDVLASTSENLMIDSGKHTYIILAAKGRAHVFSDQGMLVTSFKLTPAMLESRVNRRRWRKATEDEYNRFQTLWRKNFDGIKS